MQHEPKYTIIIQDQKYVFSKYQIEFDSPNYFTACFLGDFRESQTHRLELSRDPGLFKLVFAYMSGYKVLPLHEKAIPPDMSPAAALANLKADAEFYQLEGLIKACEELSSAKRRAQPPYRALLGVTTARSVPEVFKKVERYVIASVSQEEASRAPFSNITRPESCTGFAGLRVRGAVEEAISSRAGPDWRSKVRLVGWNVNTYTVPTVPNQFRNHSEVAILLEIIKGA